MKWNTRAIACFTIWKAHEIDDEVVRAIIVYLVYQSAHTKRIKEELESDDDDDAEDNSCVTIIRYLCMHVINVTAIVMAIEF